MKKDRIELSIEKSDWHLHSNWSDGRDEIGLMLRAAEFQGMGRVAVTDHLWAEVFPNGRNPAEYVEAVNRAAADYPGLEVHCGVEGTLLDVDGTISVPERALEMLNPVLVDFGGMTRGISVDAPASRVALLENIATAFANLCKQEAVDIVAHPFNFGRLVEGFEFSWMSDAFLKEIAECFVDGNKRFEVMNDIWWWYPEMAAEEFTGHYARIVRIFRDAGVKFSIGSDAHHHQGAGNLSYARKLLAG